jgi:hypothetical protein
MDWLQEVKDDLEKQVFDEVASLLDLEVDLLFFDTTSTYFELEDADEPVASDEHGRLEPAADADGRQWDETRDAGFRTWGNSKDSRDDLPQIVIWMAVTRDGILIAFVPSAQPSTAPSRNSAATTSSRTRWGSRLSRLPAANAGATPENTYSGRYRDPSTGLASTVLSGSSAGKMMPKTVAMTAMFKTGSSGTDRAGT